MASPLVTGGCLALRSKLNGKYVRYMPEHEEGKVLQVSGKDAISPYTRFQVEPSKKHEGHIHLRCCYNSKYWVARQLPGAWLIHAKLTANVYMLSDSDKTKQTLRGCLLLGDKDSSNKDAYMFSVINLDKQMVLPKYICFKADNDMYGRIIDDDNRYIQFSSDDIGDPRVRHTIHTNEDGTIRIKSALNDRFWRRDPNWIKADSDDTTSNNPNTLFRAVKFGDMFALQNLGNNRYCTRLTLDKKKSCLNADVSTITKESQFRLEEAVLSRRIYDVEYHLMDAKIYDKKVLTMATAQAVNRASTDNTVKVTLNYSVTKERSWESSVSLKLGVTATVSAGVPEIFGVSMELQAEITGSYTWGKSDTRTQEHSVEYEINVPKKTKHNLRVLATQAMCDVPFSYFQEDVLTTGEKVVQKFDDGIYRGVNSYDFTYEVTEEKL
ncbi:hypothetical protein BAE44_0000226 [Dichanthelium oligosanthes]|uniref:Agglutinin domain-containing protein n=1 Tax=Dichanthelium oligosanthes TaxID=888268 RepID=A0A1E5WMX1_9POAL|nr:hypothetical protein BAE44_0000226 [Dichanthelium oligosanthes]